MVGEKMVNVVGEEDQVGDEDGCPGWMKKGGRLQF